MSDQIMMSSGSGKGVPEGVLCTKQSAHPVANAASRVSLSPVASAAAAPEIKNSHATSAVAALVQSFGSESDTLMKYREGVLFMMEVRIKVA